MKMKSRLADNEAGECRRQAKPENSPVRTGLGGRASSSRVIPSKVVSKGSAGSPGPRTTSGAGRTPQTKRRELSLSTAEKNSPSGSPRNVSRTSSSGNVVRKSAPTSKTKGDQRNGSEVSANNEESSRKSSNSSQDSGIGRESKMTRGERTRSGHNLTKSLRSQPPPPLIRTNSPPRSDIEVSDRKRFEELCDIKNIELGMVKVPPDILEDLINKENIEKFYDVDEVPVASGLFATVRKCTHKETGIEYAAKYSSRLRYGVDCTMEVLHEIALLSICSESNKIVHLKDVFQNKYQIILVLEYAPGGDFQSVLDDDMVPFEQDVQGFMLQLLEALSFAHDRHIAHLDIKPQNIVLMSEFPNCEIKLCDLEVSRVIQEHEQIREIIGTPDYVAPEILAYEPISLAADIWSLGVLAYVLLTGFSPFGGETDQETLRNITSAPLDFPAELFEGVSDEAKEFIKDCLSRNPNDRPSVAECLKHPWISGHSEPPSPSPLMLKIPAPDHFNKLSVHHHLAPSPSGSSGSSRRSCATCRDKLSERKRYLSKSREAIFEKVTNSNLKKSLSKSRERLCDMRLTLGKSREYLNNESKLASRSQEKFYNFKSLSRSQEVLSQGLGGSMRRINGAVSDISPHHLPVNPRVYLDTPDNSCDFVMLPGSSVLMSHSELMSISGIRNSSSLQLLPISESGRSTPASLCSNATVADIPYREEPCNDTKSDNVKNTVVTETLVEEAEEDIDEYDNKNRSGLNNNKESREKATASVTRQLSNNNLVNSRRKSKQETSLPRTCSQKEEKNNINYETKQSLSRSGANNNLEFNNRQKNSARNNSNATAATTTSTAEVAIQVDDKDLTINVPPTTQSKQVVRRKEKLEKSDSTKSSKSESTTTSTATATSTLTPVFNNIQVDGNIRPGPQDKKLTRGFSHDNTLGEDTQKRYSWREDLEKFRTMKKPLAVSDLIDAFSTNSMQRKVSADDPSFPNVDSLKNKRRGSLQIQIDPKSLAKLTETSENSQDTVLKALRRKSTSAIMPLRLSEVKVGDSDETGDDSGEKKDDDDAIVRDTASDDSKHSKEDSSEKTVGSRESRESVGDSEDGAAGSNESINNSAYLNQSLPKGRVYLEKVNERKRTWDYFEINHPKAISDKKLEQLKAKYTRRKTENDILLSKSNNKDKNANEKLVTSRSCSSRAPHSTPPVVRTQTLAVFEGLEGSPLPKKSLDLAFDPLTGECLETESVDSGRESEMTRKLSSDSSDEGSSSRKSSKSGGRRRSSHLGDILESENIPEEAVLECFIDPFTGQFITNLAKKSENDKIETSNGANKIRNNNNNNSKNLKVNVDCKAASQVDDGFGSLPITPTDPAKNNKSLSVLKKGEADADSIIATDDGIYTTSSEETINRQSCESVSDELSVASSEDVGDVNSASREDDNGNIKALRQGSGKKINKVSKVCSGSVSRGLEKFS